MADESKLGVPFLAASLIVVSVFITWYRSRETLLNLIPAVGFSDPILSYLSAFYFSVLDGTPALKECYEKTKPGLFRIPTFRRWMVLPTSIELIDDIRKAPDDALSGRELFKEFTQLDYTLDFLDSEDAYETRVVRSRLTRNIATTLEQINDELDAAVRECIPAYEEEWVKISIMPTLQRIICRTSSRVFVGTTLCRNHEYQRLILDIVADIVKVTSILSMVPKPLKPVVARIIADLPAKIRQMAEFIRPQVEERLTKVEELGETWDDAPNDMLMWLMSEAKGIEKSVEALARRFLLLNLSSVQPTSLTIMRVLYRLLSHPEYIEPLRQEVALAVTEEGWTRAGIDKMYKLDSFLRETQRIDAESIVMPMRLTLRPFTFSNGVTIPTGTVIALPVHAIHTDEEIHPNAEEFDGFRFEKLRHKVGDNTVTKHQPIATSGELLTFGLGRHACPGRFFAVNVMKALIARIIVTYEFRFEEGKGVPSERQVGLFRAPRNADLLFRKRQE